MPIRRMFAKYFLFGFLLGAPAIVVAYAIPLPISVITCCALAGVNCSACNTLQCCVVGCSGGGFICQKLICMPGCKGLLPFIQQGTSS